MYNKKCHAIIRAFPFAKPPETLTEQSSRSCTPGKLDRLVNPIPSSILSCEVYAGALNNGTGRQQARSSQDTSLGVAKLPFGYLPLRTLVRQTRTLRREERAAGRVGLQKR